MLAVWSPVAVWAVVEADPQARGPRAVAGRAAPRWTPSIVQDTDLTADPAAVLRRVDVPVALLDGARATAAPLGLAAL